MKIFNSLILFILLTSFATAQTTVSGMVTDADKQLLLGANILVYQNNDFITGTTTDLTGKYFLELTPGTYDIMASYIGFSNLKIVDVIVEPHKNITLDFQLTEPHPYILSPIYGINIPIISPDEMTKEMIILNQEIERLPTKNIKEMSTMAPGVSFENN